MSRQLVLIGAWVTAAALGTSSGLAVVSGALGGRVMGGAEVMQVAQEAVRDLVVSAVASPSDSAAPPTLAAPPPTAVQVVGTTADASAQPVPLEQEAAGSVLSGVVRSAASVTPPVLLDQTVEPAVEPAPLEPVTAEPVVVEPVPTPAPAEPAPGSPTPSEPLPTGPAPVEPSPSEPSPSPSEPGTHPTPPDEPSPAPGTPVQPTTPQQPPTPGLPPDPAEPGDPSEPGAPVAPSTPADAPGTAAPGAEEPGAGSVAEPTDAAGGATGDGQVVNLLWAGPAADSAASVPAA